MSATDEGFVNQGRTEPIPPTPPHSLPDESAGQAADDEAIDRPVSDHGTVGAGGPGPRESSDAAPNAGAPLPGAPGIAPEDVQTEPDVEAGTVHAPHDAGRPEDQSAGHAQRQPGNQGESPEPFGIDTEEGAARTREAIHSQDTPAPGDPRSSPAPSYLAAEGTSEAASPVDGVRITAIAQPGKPDGEVDTR